MKLSLVRPRTSPRQRVFPVSVRRTRRVQTHVRWPLKNVAPRLCFGLILLFAAIGVPSPTLADEPAPVAQPPVIAFAYGGGIRQEIVFAEGAKLEVTTRSPGDTLQVSGRSARRPGTPDLPPQGALTGSVVPGRPPHQAASAPSAPSGHRRASASPPCV